MSYALVWSLSSAVVVAGCASSGYPFPREYVALLWGGSVLLVLEDIRRAVRK